MLNRLALVVAGLLLLPMGGAHAAQSKAARVARQLRASAKTPGSKIAGVTDISAKNVKFADRGTKYTVAPVYKRLGEGAFQFGALEMLQISGSVKKSGSKLSLTRMKLEILSAPKGVFITPRV